MNRPANAGDSTDQPAGVDQAPDARPTDPAPRTRLSLGDPLADTAAEDRPEAWGEAGDSDAARLAFYRAQRPPHHGG